MYVIAYDITNDKRLRKVSKELQKYGIRVQNSTFEIDKKVVDIHINHLLDTLQKICKKEDKIFFYKTNDKTDIQAQTSNWDMVF